MRESVIDARLPVHHGAEVSWTVAMAIADGEPLEATYRFALPDGARPTSSLRSALLTFLPIAMRIGDPVVVDGPVDDDTLDGLMTWQEAMARWHPGQVHVVPIRPDGTPDASSATASPPGIGAITAFSGGVDSAFTAARPRTERNRIAAGLMVHGFDIALDDDEIFAGASARSQQMLDALGIETRTLRTDVRRLEQPWSIDWETLGHGIWLAAALACFEGAYDHAVIPSTFSYDQLILPWASNPITDPMLSGAGQRVLHDGAAHDKLDKVAAVAHLPAVVSNLRVCWEGGRLDRNCGHCYKCLMTQACFWVSGVAEPSGFDPPGSRDEIGRLDLRKDRYREALAERILGRATETGDAELAAAIHRGLGR